MRAASRYARKGDDLVGPERPFGELFEVRAARSVDDLLFSYRARVHAGAAESDLRISLDRGRDHALEV